MKLVFLGTIMPSRERPSSKSQPRMTGVPSGSSTEVASTAYICSFSVNTRVSTIGSSLSIHSSRQQNLLRVKKDKNTVL